MLKITYTNGNVQNINVTGDFFTVTLAPKNGKQIKLSPIEKAEDLAFDLATQRSLSKEGHQSRPPLSVAHIELLYPGSPDPKVKVFNPIDEPEERETAEPGPSYIKQLKAWKKEHRQKIPTNNKGFNTRWIWSF